MGVQPTQNKGSKVTFLGICTLLISILHTLKWFPFYPDDRLVEAIMGREERHSQDHIFADPTYQKNLYGFLVW